MRLALGMAWISAACGSAPRQRTESPPASVLAAPRAPFRAEPGDPEWGRLAEAEIRAAIARASTAYTVECRGSRCRVEVSRESQGLSNALELPDCAVHRLGHDAAVFLVDCWEARAETRGALEARLREWSAAYTLRVTIHSLECADGRCRLELSYSEGVQPPIFEEARELSDLVLGDLGRLCGGTISGLEPAARGGSLQTVRVNCQPGHREGWATRPSDHEERADQEAVLTRLREEPRDAAWADATERALTERVTKALSPTPEISIECRGARCRIGVSFGRDEESAFEIGHGIFAFEGCEVSDLDRSAAQGPGLTRAIDCAWPNGRRPPDWASRTEAEIRRRFDELLAEVRSSASVQHVECRSTKCLVQIAQRPGAAERIHVGRFRDVAGYSAHGVRSRGDGYQSLHFECAR